MEISARCVVTFGQKRPNGAYMDEHGLSGDCCRSPLAVPLMVLSAAYMTWSVWSGIVLWVGGTIPLMGWDVAARPVWSIAWFAVGAWLTFFVVLMAVILPLLTIERLVAAWRSRATRSR